MMAAGIASLAWNNYNAGAPGQANAGCDIRGAGALDGYNPAGTSRTIAIGNVLRFALDIGTGKMWIGDSSGWYEGDPVAETSPSFNGIPAGTWFAAIALFHDSSDPTMTINFGGQSFAYPVPSGYSAYSPSPSPLVVASSFHSIEATAAMICLGWSAAPFFHSIKAAGRTAARAKPSFHTMIVTASSVRGMGKASFHAMSMAGRGGARASAKFGTSTCSAGSAMPFSGAMAFQPMGMQSRGNSIFAAGFLDLTFSGKMLCGQAASHKAAFGAISCNGRTAAREHAFLKIAATSAHAHCGSLFGGKMVSSPMQAWAHIRIGALFAGKGSFQSIEIQGDTRCPWDAEQSASMGAIQAAGILSAPSEFRGYVVRFDA
jgi:hypothetical protein